MVNAVGNSAPLTPAKKIEEKKDEIKEEAQSPSPAPAPTPAPNTDNAASDNINQPAGGLDPKVAFETSQGFQKKEKSKETNNTKNQEDEPIQSKGTEGENSAANGMKEVLEEMGGGRSGGGTGVGKGDPSKPTKPEEKEDPDTIDNAVTQDQLKDYREEAVQDKKSLDVLTDPEKLEGGKFKGKTIFEALAGDDGKLSLEEAKEAKSRTSKDLKKMKNGPLGMKAPDELIEKTERLDKALGYITTDGNFERFAGDKDYLDANSLNKAKEKQEDKIDKLDTLTDDGNFEAIAGKDKLLSKKDLDNAATKGKNDDVKSAAKWMVEDGKFDETLSQSNEATMDERLTYVLKNFKEFDTGAGIGLPDGVFSIKDLNALKDGEGETAEVARGLIKDDVIGKLGGKDGKISFNDIKTHREENADGIISNNFQQASEGNCVFLASIRAGILTDEGQKVLDKTIQKSGDGWDVRFAGDESGKPIHITEKDLKTDDGDVYSKGDKDIQILNAAAEKYFRANPDKTNTDNGVESLNGQEAGDLLFGKNAKRLDGVGGKENTSKEIKDFILKHADGVGKDVSLTVSGKANGDGSMDFSSVNHLVTIIDIDKKSGQVTYVNPWDSSKTHTISIDDLAEEMGPGSHIGGYQW